ncbi:MAG TPA: [protein-PII] uridylyltransferase [Gammaproteobacteria bacterium]|nr:[protein-PII] uridylyltransferase [Gammaproteobacteria bacterium]
MKSIHTADTGSPARAGAAQDELVALDAALAAGGGEVPAFRAALAAGDERLRREFDAGVSAEALVRERAGLVDGLLLRAWRRHAPGAELALIAVGGYGRGELHPGSDIDIGVLAGARGGAWQSKVEALLAFLWDIGLEVGHSVRTIEECAAAARDDITVATSLMEARLLDGPRGLFEAMREATGPARIWPSRAFFEAKLREQLARHRRFDDTAYNLEPNVKSGPGGLRDIQMIGWVAQRHFGASTLHELVAHDFLTANEYARLAAGQAFLWKVRFALHVLTGRREDRLLFDHQLRLAALFGYEDASHTLAVEQFMQRYYRTIIELSRLNEMLLQLFQEAILLTSVSEPKPVNARFRIRNDYLEAVDDGIFAREPSALLELFRLMQQIPGLRGVSAATIRLVRRNVELVDEEFRQHPRNHRLFMEILRAPSGVTHALRRMNLYGVLGRYIPAFGRIVGRMQYDLFHAYTVDAHTLFVVAQLRRFALERYNHEFPYCSEIMQALPKPELVYLAAVFHDIGKGRGGDHSELGAVDAEAFCIEQGLSRYDARLVAWLVRHHLMFSITAQKKDISDPQVVNDFAQWVGDQVHLDYLYVLTLADVRATNPKLWNSWKAALFEEFYERTRRALRRGLENPVDRDELIAETQGEARRLLGERGVSPSRLETVWQGLGDEYFLQHRPEEIAWHTSLLAARMDAAAEGRETEDAVVAVEAQPGRGGTAVFLYAPHYMQAFARSTAAIDALGLTIVDARVSRGTPGYSLETYYVLEQSGAMLDGEARRAELAQAIRRGLMTSEDAPVRVARSAPRQVRMFSTPTQIGFSEDPTNSRTILELIAGDRPGLLSETGQAFLAARVELSAAKIMTVGERAEDVFFITDRSGRALDATGRARLQTELERRLGGGRPA